MRQLTDYPPISVAAKLGRNHSTDGGTWFIYLGTAGKTSQEGVSISVGACNGFWTRDFPTRPVATITPRRIFRTPVLMPPSFVADYDFFTLHVTNRSGLIACTRHEIWGPNKESIYHLDKTSIGSSVLVLGPDASRQAMVSLRNIQATLFLGGINGLILKDLPDRYAETIEEKLLRYASNTSCALVEDASPSGHIDEIALLARNRFLVAILRPEGHGGTWMQSDYEIDYNNVKVFNYRTISHRRHVILDMVIPWVQKTRENKDDFLHKKYPWRQKNLR